MTIMDLTGRYVRNRSIVLHSAKALMLETFCGATALSNTASSSGRRRLRSAAAFRNESSLGTRRPL
jgi:hypothetical protein